ncbi:MAG: ATP-dependent helicase RecG [Planctomycetota bacterium]
MSLSFGKTPAQLLSTPVHALNGVRKNIAPLLGKLGLRTVRDVLFFFPRGYEDMSEVRSLATLVEGSPTSVIGTVAEVELRGTGPGKTILGVLLRDDHWHLRAVYFNQPFQQRHFIKGNRVMLSGVPRRHGMTWEMTHPHVTPLAAIERPETGQIWPVYSLTEGLTQPVMRQIVHGALDTYAPLLEETLPEDLLDRDRLWPIHAALPQLHRPTSRDSLEAARRRFIFQELLVMQLALAMRRERASRDARAVPLPLTERIAARIADVLAHTPTPDQSQAIREIAADLARDRPMNRLLQGDVGTGKTLVAQYALLIAVAHGYQAALMAPTEVLARQHARTLAASLASSRVRIGLLTGSISAHERRELLSRIQAGEVDLIVGTHAVVHAIERAQASFARLGLVVIDEQHKFGVRQRALLKQAAIAPHYLVMTATPIPRTIAMSLYGDLDVSILRQPPPGRQNVHTYHVDASQRERWWEFLRKKLNEGRQAYVIAPRVDEEAEDETVLEAGFVADVAADLSTSDAGIAGIAAVAGIAGVAGDGDSVNAADAADASGAAVAAPPSEAAQESMAASGPVPTENHGMDAGAAMPSYADASAAADTAADASSGSPAVQGESAPKRGLASVKRLYEELSQGVLAGFTLDLVHGRLTAVDKDAAMERFRAGTTQVLVATSVVEVGVDVANATLMVIEDGNQFGLSQLHQLRGRVSRGRYPGYVAVFADAKSADARRRLAALCATRDGFELAEIDFQLRGPGDLFGTRQHGLPPLRIADFQRDGAVMAEARESARRVVSADPGLDAPPYARLRKMVLGRYGRALDLGDVG